MTEIEREAEVGYDDEVDVSGYLILALVAALAAGAFLLTSSKQCEQTVKEITR